MSSHNLPVPLPGEKHTLVGGTVLVNVHKARPECFTKYCCIHWPSKHHLADWPQNWREDRKIMERMCEHGVGHPDPDDVAFNQRLYGVDVSDHGCDGCCVPPHNSSR